MKLLRFRLFPPTLVLLLLVAAVTLSQLPPRSARADNGVLLSWAFSANGSLALALPDGTQSCNVEVTAGSTMGGGSILLQTEGSSVPNATTGYPDLGKATNGSQTLTSAGTSLNVPTGSQGFLVLTLSGATSPSISGFARCSSSAVPIAPPTPSPAPAWSVVYAATSAITATTSTTTLVYTNSTGATMYVHFMAALSIGTNSAAVAYIETGTQTTNPCDTATQVYMPSGLSLQTSSGSQIALWGGGGVTNFGIIPAVRPLPLTNGVQLCVVSQGTTVNFKAYAILAPTTQAY